MKGRRTGITIRESGLRKDSRGFDDIDAFWDAATSASSRKSSILTDKSADVYYDTSSVISEDESIISAATDEQITRTPELSPIPRGSPTPASRKKPTKPKTPVNDPDEGDDYDAGFGGDDDYGFGDDEAPFNADESPLPAEKTPAKSRGSSSRRSSVGPKPTDAKSKGSTKKRPVEKTPESRKKKRTSFSTPATTPGDMSFMDTPKTGEFARAYTLPDETFVGESGDETDEDDADTSFQPDTSSFLASARKHAALVTDDSDDEGHGLRRSKRATKGQTFKWWKGTERRVYKAGQLQGVLEGSATPAPKMKKHANTKKGTKVKHERHGDLEPLDPALLPEDVKFQRSENFKIYDSVTDGATTEKIVCLGASLRPQDLPVTTKRPPGKNLVCQAAQSFSVESGEEQSGWISGIAVLPPQAIKDAEGVGACAQVYYVADAQPRSLEVAIGSPESEDFEDETAQRIILSAGDQFYVPPGNTYRLENHSRTHDARLFWVIVKPVA